MKSLPLSGPPSRDSSPPPGGRYGAGWYEESRRYPQWDRYGGPPSSDLLASMDDFMSRRRRETQMRSQEFELARMLKVRNHASFVALCFPTQINYKMLFAIMLKYVFFKTYIGCGRTQF